MQLAFTSLCTDLSYRRVKFERSAKFPAMEEQLHKEFRELRRRGIKVKGWWFKSRAKQLLELSNPNNSFVYSDGWFLALSLVTDSAWGGQLTQPNVSQTKRRQLFKNFINKSENVSSLKVEMDLKRRNFSFTKSQMSTKPHYHLPSSVVQRTRLPIHQRLGTWCIIWTRQTSVYGAAHHFCRWEAQGQATAHLQRNWEADIVQRAS